MKKILIMILCLIAIESICAQNNPFIFFGGNGDGLAVNNYAQATTSTLVHGGNGDGFAATLYIQSTDGTLSRGGNGDGFALSNYLQATDSTLNLGSIGDGFTTIKYVQITDRTLYHGGQGDGWANIYYPLNPLPVDLISFTGKKVNDGHLLQWQTVNEINVAHYRLERSIDTRNYNLINKQDAKGNGTSQTNQYRFTDAAPSLGDNYYRLRISDIDGIEKLSNIVMLRVTDKGKTIFTLFPNPTAHLLHLKMSGIAAAEKVEISISDSKGSQVYKGTATGEQQVQIAVQSLAKGTYILTIYYSNKQESIRFVKQ
jgi:hypothetical protein